MSSGLVAPNIVLVANAVGLVASCYVDLCMLVHSATPDGLTTVPPDQFLTAKKNVATYMCFVCTNHGIPPPPPSQG